MRYHISTLDPTFPPDRIDYHYRIDFRNIGGGGMINFHEVRRWLGDTYGWSDHVGDTRSDNTNEYWTWLVKMDEYVIYLKSDKELMLFKLRFPIKDDIG